MSWWIFSKKRFRVLRFWVLDFRFRVESEINPFKNQKSAIPNPKFINPEPFFRENPPTHISACPPALPALARRPVFYLKWPCRGVRILKFVRSQYRIHPALPIGIRLPLRCLCFPIEPWYRIPLDHWAACQG